MPAQVKKALALPKHIAQKASHLIMACPQRAKPVEGLRQQIEDNLAANLAAEDWEDWEVPLSEAQRKYLSDLSVIKWGGVYLRLMWYTRATVKQMVLEHWRYKVAQEEEFARATLKQRLLQRKAEETLAVKPKANKGKGPRVSHADATLVGCKLEPSKSKRTFPKDPTVCKHSVTLLEAGGNGASLWWLCLGCGNRYQRLTDGTLPGVSLWWLCDQTAPDPGRDKGKTITPTAQVWSGTVDLEGHLPTLQGWPTQRQVELAGSSPAAAAAASVPETLQFLRRFPSEEAKLAWLRRMDQAKRTLAREQEYFLTELPLETYPHEATPVNLKELPPQALQCPVFRNSSGPVARAAAIQPAPSSVQSSEREIETNLYHGKVTRKRFQPRHESMSSEFDFSDGNRFHLSPPSVMEMASRVIATQPAMMSESTGMTFPQPMPDWRAEDLHVPVHPWTMRCPTIQDFKSVDPEWLNSTPEPKDRS